MHLSLRLAALALLAAPGIALDDNPTLAPAQAEAGTVYQWRAADGLAFEYRVPERYDPGVGANLTLVLHGNGLDHRWTFWNHPEDEFRPHDIVVSPDGTTPHAGTGANEFLAGAADVARVKALVLELKATWNVRQVFLYGHSQGSFFVFLFAGAEPELVDGVVGHAGGVWNGTEAPKAAHHQAIGFLHGTEDHVPYGQSVAGRAFYAEERKYPLVHLRTLFGWDHRPHWYQAAQVLAWCEGMTSDEPARVAAALEELCDTKRPMGVDWSALRAVAGRLAALEGATAPQRSRAKAAAAAVDALADEHVDEVLRGAGKKGLGEFRAGEWTGRLARFLEEFHGTPAWEALAKKHGKRLDAVRDAGAAARRDLQRALEQDDAEAVTAAATLVEAGYLDAGVAAALDRVDAWLEATQVKVPRKACERYAELAGAWREARAEGARAFERANARVKP